MHGEKTILAPVWRMSGQSRRRDPCKGLCEVQVKGGGKWALDMGKGEWNGTYCKES